MPLSRTKPRSSRSSRRPQRCRQRRVRCTVPTGTHRQEPCHYSEIAGSAQRMVQRHHVWVTRRSLREIPAMRWMAAVMLTLAGGFCATAQANEVEALFQEAVQAAQADNYDTALAKFEAALQADPNNLRYGNAYRLTIVKINQVNTYDRCIAFFQKLVT